MSLIQGDQTREFSALRQGVIDMAVGSTINWSPQVKELNLFSMPFLMPDYAAVDALTQGEVGKKIFQTIEKAGVVPLAWGENGYRELTNSKKPIKSPEDLKGMKIRVVGSPLFSDTFTALGANPTQMSWADAQPALASGAVDGQENPLFLFTVLKMHTVGQKFVTTWGYVTDPLIFVVNKEIWNSWTPADQAIVRQAADRRRQAGNRAGPQGPGRSRQAVAEGNRRHGRDGDPADAGRARGVREGDAAGLRQVEEDRGRGPGERRREVDRCTQQVVHLFVREGACASR